MFSRRTLIEDASNTDIDATRGFKVMQSGRCNLESEKKNLYKQFPLWNMTNLQYLSRSGKSPLSSKQTHKSKKRVNL